MINFVEGQIKSGEKIIDSASNAENLKALSEEGLIERRENGRGEPYYYTEFIVDGMRFGLFIRLREKKIQWLVLRWLDGPCTSKGWEGVSDEAQRVEYRQLLHFVEERVGRPPDHKKNRQRTWLFKWGQVEVSYEPRDFATNIFMVPR